ncbi:hypothetical protein ACL02T_32880 [Pseudonocardia sp. RS010]|uniref:hypothetical protein n=1 Tax=Pseudonocardia sp. RS010 TaxID=3385979 RepID=UPI00399FF803
MSDLSARAGELADEVSQLRAAVEGLSKGQEALDRRTGRAERLSVRTALAGAALGILILLGIVLVTEQRSTQEQLDGLVQQSLCPTFQLLVGGYDPTTRPPGEARDKYEDAFAQIREALAALHCTGGLVPPRIER